MVPCPWLLWGWALCVWWAALVCTVQKWKAHVHTHVISILDLLTRALWSGRVERQSPAYGLETGKWMNWDENGYQLYCGQTVGGEISSCLVTSRKRLPCHHLHPQNGQACFFWGSWDCSDPGDRRCVAAWHMSLCACVSGLLEAVHGGTDECHPKLGMGQPWNPSSCDDNQRASLALSRLPCGCLILWLDGASLGSSVSPFPVCGRLSVASVSSSAWCFSCPSKRGRFFCKCGAESWLCPCSSEHSGFLLFPPSCQVGDSALWPAEGMEGVLVEGFAEHRKMSRNEQINTGECYPNTEELAEWLSIAALVSELSHTRSTHLLLWKIHGISMEKLGWSPRGNWSQDTPQGGDSKRQSVFLQQFF